LTFHLLIEQKQADKINGFDQKSRRITKEKPESLRKIPVRENEGIKRNYA